MAKDRGGGLGEIRSLKYLSWGTTVLVVCLAILVGSVAWATSNTPETEKTDVGGWELEKTTHVSDDTVGCDSMDIASLPIPEHKDDVPFPPGISTCLMEERFGDEESAYDARERVIERFRRMAASYAGVMISAYKHYSVDEHSRENITGALILASLNIVRIDPVVVERRAVKKSASDDGAKPWLIVFSLKTRIPKAPVAKAFENVISKYQKGYEALQQKIDILTADGERDQAALVKARSDLGALGLARGEEREQLLQTISTLERRIQALKKFGPGASAQLSRWSELKQKLADPGTSWDAFEGQLDVFCRSVVPAIRNDCRALRLGQARSVKNVYEYVRWARELGDHLDPWHRHLLGVAYWRYYAEDADKVMVEFTRALKEAKNDTREVVRSHLKEMHYNTALFYASLGDVDKASAVLDDLPKEYWDEEGVVLRAVLDARTTQRNVCNSLRSVCGKFSSAAEKPVCEGWFATVERGDCLVDGGARAVPIGTPPSLSSFSAPISDPFGDP